MKRQSCPGMIINPPPLSRDSESKKENGRHYHRRNDGHLLHHHYPPNEDVSSQRPYYPFWEKMFQHFNQVLHHQRFIGYCVWMNQPITMQIISVFDHLNLDDSAKIYDKEHTTDHMYFTDHFPILYSILCCWVTSRESEYLLDLLQLGIIIICLLLSLLKFWLCGNAALSEALH